MPDVINEPTYGGCEGSESMYVKLISSDGHEFIIKREYVLISSTICAMMSGPGFCPRNEINAINLRETPSRILQKVCQYFIFRNRYANSTTEIPEFLIEPEFGTDLFMASCFLDC